MIKPTKEEATFSWFPNKEIYGADERAVETIATTKSRSNGRSKGVLIKTTLFIKVYLKVRVTRSTPVNTKRTINLGVSKNSVVRFANKNKV